MQKSPSCPEITDLDPDEQTDEKIEDASSHAPGPAERKGHTPRLLWVIFIGLSLLLLGGSVYRAMTYPFVHDESLSFAIFTFEPRFGETANHHLLNTWAMEACARLFGNSELALRLPNLLAHLVYLGATLALLRRLGHPLVQICAFVLLNLNPFTLDFFFLARGYGIALSMLTLSLALLTRGSEEVEIVRRRRWLLAALAAGAVSVLANYSFLFFYLTLHGVVGLLYFPPGSRRWDSMAAAAIVLSGIYLAFIVRQVRGLAARGELYFGGSEGFWHDTVRSLSESTLYGVKYPAATVTILTVAATGLLVVAMGIAVWQAWRGRRFTLGLAFAALLVGAALLPILSHALGQSLLPLGRAALPFLPLAAVALCFSWSDLWRSHPAKWIAQSVVVCALLIAVVGTAHFVTSYNFSTCHVWPGDVNNKAALGAILRDHRERGSKTLPRVAVHWFFLPAFTFYQATLPPEWLAPMKNLSRRVGDEDYVYVIAGEAAPLIAKDYAVLVRYPDSDTVLLRRR